MKRRENTVEAVMLPLAQLTPHEQNARAHSQKDIDAIKESIKKYGFRDPIGVWGPDNIIVEGHGRRLAALELGMESVPCIRLDDMTDEERRAYAIWHNRTAELSAWDWPTLDTEKLELELKGFDFSVLQFEMPEAFGGDEEERAAEFFARERGISVDDIGEEDPEYQAFVEKFKPKKTTDDCYTPETIYDIIADWAAKEYGLKRSDFVRPFYPGGDYTKYNYGKSAVVVDNPPFSILSEIIRFYAERGIRFFLFAPTLTLFTAADTDCSYIATKAAIVYENGATVNTSFVTNLDDCRVRTAPDLCRAVKEESERLRQEQTKTVRKLKYPDGILLAAIVSRWSELGIEFKVPKESSTFIRKLDAQEPGDNIYGGAFLLSQAAAAQAAQAAAAQAAAAICYDLSERELEMQRALA